MRGSHLRLFWLELCIYVVVMLQSISRSVRCGAIGIQYRTLATASIQHPSRSAQSTLSDRHPSHEVHDWPTTPPRAIDANEAPTFESFVTENTLRDIQRYPTTPLPPLYKAWLTFAQTTTGVIEVAVVGILIATVTSGFWLPVRFTS